MASAYPKHRKALALARADLRAGVKEKPLGSNTNGRVRQMQAHTWLGGTGWPWCVAACITWAEEAGFVLPYQGAGAFAYLDWAKAHGWTCAQEDAVPGDFVVFNLGSGHMAMLADPIKTKYVSTVDGNSSDRVKENSRPTYLIRGIVHLPEEHAEAPAKPPLFEVVTSENGHRVLYVSTASKVGQRIPKILAKHAKVTVQRRKR